MFYRTIFQAITANNFEAIKEFTEQRKIKKNAVNKNNYSVVELAFYNCSNNIEILKYLLKNDYPLPIKSSKMPGIVYNIIKNDNDKILELFISYGLPFTYKSLQGFSMLEYAFFYNSTKCLHILKQHMNIEEDPFLMISKGKFLHLIKFLKNNPNYNIFTKKGYKNLLSESLINKNIKIFIYLLKNFYSKSIKNTNSFLNTNDKLLFILTQFKNDAYLKAIYKYLSLDSIIKMKLLKSAVAHQNLTSVEFVYDHFNESDKINENLYRNFKYLYKNKNTDLITLLYKKCLEDRENSNLREHTKKAEHPFIFFLEQYNKTKYDYYLELFPKLYAKEIKEAVILGFKNCNLELIKKFYELNSSYSNETITLISAFISGNKSANIKYNFLKKLRELNIINDDKIYKTSIGNVSFYLHTLFLGNFELFCKIIQNEKIEKRNLLIEKGEYEYYEGINALLLILNNESPLNGFYKEKTKASSISSFYNYYLKTALYLIQTFNTKLEEKISEDMFDNAFKKLRIVKNYNNFEIFSSAPQNPKDITIFNLLENFCSKKIHNANMTKQFITDIEKELLLTSMSNNDIQGVGSQNKIQKIEQQQTPKRRRL